MVMYFNLYTLQKKLKKREQQKKNRYHQMIFHLARMRQAEARKRHEEGLKSLSPKRDQKPNDKEWSDKVSKVRNRLTGRKRASKERWNRFAGTSDAGGRGL